MKEMNYSELVRMTKEGDASAFRTLYEGTCNRVYFLAKSFLGNEEDARDIVQEAYVTAWKSISMLNAPERFPAWIETIATNKCKDLYRKRIPTPIDGEVLEDLVNEETDFQLPEDYVLQEEKREILFQIMRDVLSVNQYQTVLLYYFSNLSISEVALQMGCNENAVKNRLSVSRAKLKEEILRLEEKKGVKLYSFAGVPILALIFSESAKCCSFAESEAVYGSITNALAGANAMQAGTIASSAANAAAGVAGKAGRAAEANLLKWIIGGVAALAAVIALIVVIPKLGGTKNPDKEGEVASSATSKSPAGKQKDGDREEGEGKEKGREALPELENRVIAKASFRKAFSSGLLKVNGSETTFVTTDKENKEVVDEKGNRLALAGSSHVELLGDGYYGITDGINTFVTIVKDDQEILTFPRVQRDSDCVLTYHDGVVIYDAEEDNVKYLVAYDLENKKELWKVKGNTPIYEPNSGYIICCMDGFMSWQCVLDLEGNVLFADSEGEVYVRSTNTRYFYVEYHGDRIEVYDGSKKINELSLKPEEDHYYEYAGLTTTGLIVVRDGKTHKYYAMDHELNIVWEMDGYKTVPASKSDELMTMYKTFGPDDVFYARNCFKAEGSSYVGEDAIFFADGTVMKLLGGRTVAGSIETYGVTQDTRFVCGGITKTDEAGEHDVNVIVNLMNGKTYEGAEDEYIALKAESPNGKYLIVTQNKMNQVFDENLNVIYESDQMVYEMKPLNDKCVIEYANKAKDEIYVVDLETKERTRLDVEGTYYNNNARAIITHAGEAYNLYEFE